MYFSVWDVVTDSFVTKFYPRQKNVLRCKLIYPVYDRNQKEERTENFKRADTILFLISSGPLH